LSISRAGKKSAQAQSDRAKELNARAKIAAESFAKIRNQALSLFAVFTAGKGVSNFTSDTISSTAALGRLSENTGVAESKLAALNLMAKNAGGSAEEMMGAVGRAAKVVADFQLGMRGEEVASFFQWGGTNEGLQDTESYLLAVSAILKKAMEERTGCAIDCAAHGLWPEPIQHPERRSRGIKRPDGGKRKADRHQ